MKLGNARKWSIQRILWMCFLPLVVLLVIMAIVFYLQVRQIDSNISQIGDVQNPLETTAQQMRITLGDIGVAVSGYISERDTAYESKIQESEDDFKQYLDDFINIAETDEERQQSEEISKLFEEFKSSTDEVVKYVDQQYVALNLFGEDIEVVDSLIDETLLVITDTKPSEAIKKLEATLNMEESLDRTSAAIESYILNGDVTSQQELSDAQADFEQSILTYEETEMTDYEERWLIHISDSFDEAVSDGLSTIAVADTRRGSVGKFELSNGKLVAYLEDSVQPFLSAQSASTIDNARDSATAANISFIILVILGILIGAASILVISRMITSPIREIVVGAETVDSGKLGYRFNADARGEFGQLAFALNRMLHDLQRSKDVLGESEETAWQILDSTTDSVILTDRRGLILASNDIAAERYGKSLEQMIDTNFYDLLPDDLKASRKAQITNVIRTGQPVHFEDERDGMILDHRIYPVLGARGEVSRIAIFARDVTTHKWVEEVTEQLGRRNELILEAAGEGIYGLDTEGRTTFVNPAAASMLGYKPEDLIGQLHHELVHHSRADGTVYPLSQCPIYAAFKDGTVHTSVDNEVFWRKDGTSFAVEYMSTPIIDKGKIAGAVVTFRDIAERKRMEDLLRKSEERYRTVFESAANLIISIDREGIILDCNSRSRDILGYEPEEMIGKVLLNLIQTGDREKAQVSLNEALEKGFDYHKRYKMVRKDGKSIDVQMNAAAAKDSEGKYIRTICMIDTE